MNAMPHSRMSTMEPAWHAGLLRLLPAVQSQLRFAFRKLRSEERAEAIAECLASIVTAYARLCQQGKPEVAYACTLADFAVRQYSSGRRVGSQLNVDDVTSPYSQRRRGFHVQSLDQRDPAGNWKETLVEDKRVTPAELAATRIDVSDWLDRLPRRKRRIAETLAAGETTKATSCRFGLTPGRVSQLRRELEADWAHFQGEPLDDRLQACATNC